MIGKVTNTVVSVLFLFIVLFGTGKLAFSQSHSPKKEVGAEPQGLRKGQAAIAVVNGRRVITEKEIDEAIGHQLFALQEKIYNLRKKALENLVVKIVLTQEAEKRGLTEEQLTKELLPSNVDVKQTDIDRRYAEDLGTLGDMNEDEAKQRIKLDMESRLKLEKYRAAVTEIIARAKVETLLSEPVPAPVPISAEGPSKGPQDAAVTIVEFSDFQCPYCRQAASGLSPVLQTYGSNVRLVFKHMPLTIHPDAFKAAQASVCANQQGKFWEYHNILFNSGDLSEKALTKYASDLGLKTDEFKACLGSDASAEVVRKDLQQGTQADVQGTPTFFVNGKIVRGLKSFDDFRKVIDQALSQHQREAKQSSSR